MPGSHHPRLIRATAADVRQLDEATLKLELHGARYPEHLQKLVGR
jgi:hypothetical protein